MENRQASTPLVRLDRVVGEVQKWEVHSSGGTGHDDKQDPLKGYIDMKQLGDIAAMFHYLSAIECLDLEFEFVR